MCHYQGTPNKGNIKSNKIDFFSHLKTSDFLKKLKTLRQLFADQDIAV